MGLVAAAAALAALPASALAAGESLSFNLSSTQAGSNPTVTANLTFAGGGDTPKTVVLALAPGLAANLNANPSCIAPGSAQQLTAACQVGTATITTNGGPANGNVYLVPPQAPTDFAGLETVATGVPNQYTGASLRQTPTVGVNLTSNFTDTRPVTINGLSITLNPTLNNIPFTVLPTSCGTATSTATITYYGGTTSTNPSGSFTPTGCSNLKYAPKLSATITKDKRSSGASIVLTQTQAIGESASKTIVFTLPSGLRPNVGADVPCLTGSGSGCVIGTAVATSAGIPNAALAKGTVRLGGSATTPIISVSFPAPFALTDTGQVDLTHNTVTFANVPDVPLTSLALNVTGPNGQKAFTTDCTPANVSGAFTGQNNATENVTTPIKFTNCPVPSGSTGGLAKGHPKLTFTVKDTAGVASVAIGLARGLTFSRSAIVSHRVCTTKPKRCTTTTLISGLGIKGAKAKSVAIRGGKLVITLKKPSGNATITVSAPLLSESKSLQNSVKKHRTKSLTFSLKVTDAGGTAPTLPLKLKAH